MTERANPQRMVAVTPTAKAVLEIVSNLFWMTAGEAVDFGSMVVMSRLNTCCERAGLEGVWDNSDELAVIIIAQMVKFREVGLMTEESHLEAELDALRDSQPGGIWLLIARAKSYGLFKKRFGIEIGDILVPRMSEPIAVADFLSMQAPKVEAGLREFIEHMDDADVVSEARENANLRLRGARMHARSVT